MITNISHNPGLVSVTEAGEAGARPVPLWKYWKRRRILLAILLFFGFFYGSALRLDLSNDSGREKPADYNDQNLTFESAHNWKYYTSTESRNGFFVGYLLTQVPGGWLASRYGGRTVFLIGLSGTALLTFIPPATQFNGTRWYVLVFSLEGLFQGVIFPSTFALWARWVPPLERTRVLTLSLSGAVCASFFTALLSKSIGELLGWAYIVYFFGLSALVWCAVWRYCARNDPELDARISHQELKYIQESIGQKFIAKKISHPWLKILTSRAVWSIILIHFASNWSLTTIAIQLDLYFAGPLASLPYLTMIVTMLASGYLSDWLIIHRKLSVTDVRKLVVCSSSLAHVLSILFLTFPMSNTVALLGFALAGGMSGVAWAGFGVNVLDIAPQHASVVFGISNTIATLPLILVPLLAKTLVLESQVKTGWVAVMHVSNAVVLFAACCYAVNASGDVQKWAVTTAPARLIDTRLT